MSTQYYSRCCDTLVFTKDGDPFVVGSLLRASEITYPDGSKPVPGPTKPVYCPGCGLAVHLSSRGVYPLIEMQEGHVHGLTFIEDGVQEHPG
jgi:hypothetical protein